MATSVEKRPSVLESASSASCFSCSSDAGSGNRFISCLESEAEVKREIDGDTSSEEEDGLQYKWEDLINKGRTEVDELVLDKRDERTPDHWVLREASMIRLTGKHPFNSEPPLERLMRHGFITPVQLHYVRNHGYVPKATWAEWTLEVCGLVKRPATFSMDQLVAHFPDREFPATLVCSGNRRKEQNMVKQTVGFNWGVAAISTSVWRGVSLWRVLRHCGILSRRRCGALNICFEGAEELPGGGGSKYGTSIRKEIAMDPSRDVILAYMHNGRALAPDHGFPLRLIAPGFIGGRMVKWLKRIIVTTHESDSYYHYRDNKVLPSHVDAQLADAEAWWYKPEYVINELNVNSAITSPNHDELLPMGASTANGLYTLRGYAYSGGGRRVTRVEVTMDSGDTWRKCTVDHQEKPNKYGKYWCWCFWQLDVEVVELFGAKDIAVRAWDESHNTQPERLIWNLMGMMNNCWFRVRTRICKTPDGLAIVFHHPTQPGNQPGGWMARERLDGKQSCEGPPKATTTYSINEVRKHNSASSAWIVVRGEVYDCTSFLLQHPGGPDSILLNAGADCTEEFEAIHSDKARLLLQKYRLGELAKQTDETSPPLKLETSQHLKQGAYALNNGQVNCALVSRTPISRDVRRLSFKLPYPDQYLGLPVGKHILLSSPIDGKLCMRAYTPTSATDEKGFFDLVVKVYIKNQNPKFPQGGLMSQHLDSIPLGSVLKIKGPLGQIEYLGRGRFVAQGKSKFAKSLAMVAGGTGITPIYQIIQAVLQDRQDDTQMLLVYANRTEEDILLREELDRFAEKDNRLKVWYVVENTITKDWPYITGRINQNVLQHCIPEASSTTLALTCGPPPMIQFAVIPSLHKLGYDVEQSLLVF